MQQKRPKNMSNVGKKRQKRWRKKPSKNIVQKLRKKQKTNFQKGDKNVEEIVQKNLEKGDENIKKICQMSGKATKSRCEVTNVKQAEK